MTLRKRLTPSQRLALLKREHHTCHICRTKIQIGQRWEVSHEIPLELHGPDDDQNRRAAHYKCHRDYTATIDIPAIARSKRIEAKHFAGRSSARPMRGGRHDTLKRKMDGTVVLRATGRPLFPTRSAA